jgi:hypothetical protein
VIAIMQRTDRTDASHAGDRTAQPRDVHGPPRIGHAVASTGISHRRTGPQSEDEAQEQYVAARDAWTAAMRAAGSGRPADMASLAIAQEAYEAASAELERWLTGRRIAVPVEPDKARTAINVVVGQELAWRKVHGQETKRPGLIGRLLGRKGRR